jgi:DnaK suppressor protein
MKKDPRLSAVTDTLRRKKDEILEAHRKSRLEGREAAESGVQDEGDRAMSAHAREFLFSLSETERQQLQLVEEALARIPEGNFGTCRECGEPIEPKRLQAVPWAERCLKCQEQVERELV